MIDPTSYLDIYDEDEHSENAGEKKKIVGFNPLGMHPGVMNNIRVSPKVNTSKPHQGGGKLAKKQKRLSDRRNAHSMTLKMLPTNANPLAFKTPGSMNNHK